MPEAEERKEVIIDFKSKAESADYLAKFQDRQKLINDYIKEYDGDRKLRALQVGNRPAVEVGAIQREAVKLLIKYQKKIVRTPVTFMLGKQPTVTPTDTDSESADLVLKNFYDNRIPSKLIKFAESVMSTGIGCFIFNKELNPDGTTKIATRFYDSREGNYYPRYNDYGDLVAFYWTFEVNKVKQMWIFTDTEIHFYQGDKYEYQRSEVHGFDVIPVVFQEQEEPEWYDVKEMIDRLEMIISKLSGSNDYFAFPILKLTGAVEKNAEGKEESTIDIDDDGSALMLGYAIKEGHVLKSEAEFLERDTGVDSIKLEVELLKEFIHNISQTPDFSFGSVKGIGALSGRALELMFMDAINKAVWKQGEYRTTIERILNVISSGLRMNSDIPADQTPRFDVRFNLSLPKDLKEEIQILLEASGNRAVMSQERAVAMNPLVDDAEAEMITMKKERAESMAGTFNSNTGETSEEEEN